MSYSYETEKPKILTDVGQREFLKVRDEAHRLLDEAGAFTIFKPSKGISGDLWTMMAYVDRLVELGEIEEITGSDVAGQHRVFIRKKV